MLSSLRPSFLTRGLIHHPEVGPIARRCVLGEATLHIPISHAQLEQYELGEEQLVRHGRFLYYQVRDTHCA